MASGTLLIVDDDESTRRMLTLGCEAVGYRVHSVESGEAALDWLRQAPVDVVLADLNMHGMNGTELCRRLAEEFPDIPAIVMTAFGTLENAVETMRVGAYDFLSKPLSIDALLLAVDRAVTHHGLRVEVKRLRAVAGESGWGATLVGSSRAMNELRELLERVAATDSTVLLTGESGTGKEVVARALHQHGRRRSGPFVALNCAAVPDGLLESELFGHAKGAYTDAKAARVGLLVQASSGTLFLDEVGDMPQGLQAKLLRALEERVVRPVGGTAEVAFDARVIAATNRDLERAIDESRFRDDLYYRLSVLTVQLPPLRARGSDILLLAQHFISQYSTQMQKPVTSLSEPAAKKMLAYPWPGNVRELRNCIERAVALTRYDQVAADDLPDKIKAYVTEHVLVAGNDLAELVPLEEVERRYILRVLEAAGGNKSLAAKTLGLNRKTLYRRLAEYGIVDSGLDSEP